MPKMRKTEWAEEVDDDFTDIDDGWDVEAEEYVSYRLEAEGNQPLQTLETVLRGLSTDIDKKPPRA